jgi:hypothetical protein
MQMAPPLANRQEKISTTRAVAEFRGLFFVSPKEASIWPGSDSLHATGHKADGKFGRCPSGPVRQLSSSFVKNRAASTERRYYISPTCLRPAIAIDCLHRGIQTICHGNIVYNNRPSKIATDSPQST